MNKQRNNNIPLYTPAIFFILTAGYFTWLGEYVLFFQEQEALFVYTSEYLKEFLARPGGAAEYAGLFLTQFYYYPAIGVIILAVVLTLTPFLLLSTDKRNGADPFFSLTFMIPPCILLLMQSLYYHLMVYNLGYLAVLAAYRLTAGKGGKPRITPAALLFVVLYYIAGGFAWIFLAMCVNLHGNVLKKQVRIPANGCSDSHRRLYPVYFPLLHFH